MIMEPDHGLIFIASFLFFFF